LVSSQWKWTSSARTYAASLHSDVGIKERVESWKIAPEWDYYRDQIFSAVLPYLWNTTSLYGIWINAYGLFHMD
jgi:hypothetical protein